MLRLENVSRHFGDFRAVDQLSLEVRSGEIVGLLGPNGAGKTTTVKMLMGMMRQSAGGLSLFGMDCFSERSEVQKRVGFLPDEPNFQSHLRGIELLEFVGKVRGLSAEAITVHVDDVGDKLGLVEDLGEFAANYSKGMRKKLAFLMATVHPGTSFPPVFLLGLASAFPYLRSRSVLPGMVLHAIYNLGIVGLALWG